MTNSKDTMKTVDSCDASIQKNASMMDFFDPKGVFTAVNMRVVPEHFKRAEQIALQIGAHDRACVAKLLRPNPSLIDSLQAELDSFPREPVWEDTFRNTVMTGGKNDLFDKYFAGSGYTAAFYMGLISSTSWSAVNAADTMASHAGWLEAGVANAPTYSQSARPTAAWSSASAGAKALSASLTFSITGPGTIKGSFMTTNATIDGTTGVLFSGGTFSGGDKTVAASDSIAVSYSISA